MRQTLDILRPAQLLAFIQLGRPHFLAGGFLFYALGAAIARFQGASLDWRAYIWGQVAVTATQWMVHYANDYFDLDADRANHTPTRWSGGSRILPDGRLPPYVALVAAYLLAVLALSAVAVVGLAVRPGPLAVPLLLMAWAAAWFYSAPPVRLTATGLGELTTALVVPILTPLASYYIQRGRLTWLPLLATLPLAYLQFAMLLAIEFPDAVGDAQTGKRTLVVRLGPARAARLVQLALALVYVALPVGVWYGLPWQVAVSASLASPLALWQTLRIRRGGGSNPARWNSLALRAIALLMVTTALEMAAFVALIATAQR